MRLNLDGGYYITEGYGGSVVLNRGTISINEKTKEERLYERAIGYYAVVDQALTKYATLITQEDLGEISLGQYVDKIHEVTESLKALRTEISNFVESLGK